MKLEISKKSLTNVLRQLDKVIVNRPGLPILANILIECINSKAVFSASNKDTRIKLTTDAKVLEEGSTTVPAKKLKSLISTIKGGDITLSSDDRDLVTISGGTFKTSLYGMPAANYPDDFIVNSKHKVTLNATELREGLLLCEHSISRDDSRRALTGALLSFKDNHLSIAGTDGKRLSWYNKPIQAGEDAELIIALDQIKVLTSVLSTGDVALDWDNVTTNFMLVNNNLEIRGRYIGGNFPEFKKVIPTEFKTWIKIPRVQLLEKLETVKLVLSRREDPVIYFLLKDNILTLVGSSAEFGNSADAIEVESDAKKALEFAFNPIFLLDLFKNTGGEFIKLRIKDCISPFVFTLNNEQDFTEVIMPLHNIDKDKAFYELAKEYKENFERDLKKTTVVKPVEQAPVEPVDIPIPSNTVVDNYVPCKPENNSVPQKPTVIAIMNTVDIKTGEVIDSYNIASNNIKHGTNNPKPVNTPVVNSKPAIIDNSKLIKPAIQATGTPPAVEKTPQKTSGFSPEGLYRIRKNAIKAMLRKKLGLPSVACF